MFPLTWARLPNTLQYIYPPEIRRHSERSKKMSGQRPHTPQRPMAGHMATPPATTPTFILHTPQVDFVENRMPTYHVAFDTSGIRYSDAQHQFVPLQRYSPVTYGRSAMTIPGSQQDQVTLSEIPSPPRPRPTPGSINDMSFWSEVFPEAMYRLNQEPILYKGPYRKDWGIRHLSVWPDVQAKLDMACRSYDYRNQQHVGKFRRKVRSFMDKAAVPLQQGMKLVPDIEIASPVLGVIDFLLDAYRQAAEVRDTINSGFDDLPELFGRMDFTFKSFPGDHNIIDHSVSLVLSIFKAVEETVEFYTSVQAERAGKALFNGEQYQYRLLRSLTEIKVQYELLQKHAEMSFQHRLLSDGDETRKWQAKAAQDNWITHQVLGELAHTTDETKFWVCNLVNGFTTFLSDLQRNWIPGSPIPSRPGTPLLLLPQTAAEHRNTSVWAPRDLWSLMQIPNIDETDLTRVLQTAGEIFHQDRGRAEQVLATPHFRSWMAAPGSSKLLVHGDFVNTSAADRPVSPFSVLCATLVKALRLSYSSSSVLSSPSSSTSNIDSQKGMISLVFFCGCHLQHTDQYWGGGVMIRSLIAQLLRQFPSPIIESPSGPWMLATLQDSLQRGELLEDVPRLCALFEFLVRRLPPGMTVFCLIDGINLYESDEYLHGMDIVVMTLLGLVDGDNSDRDRDRHGHGDSQRSKFKLLLMSPRPTVEVRQVFDHEPGTLLHMAQLPTLEGGISFARIQEQVGVVSVGTHGMVPAGEDPGEGYL